MPPLSDDDQRLLLRIARRALEDLNDQTRPCCPIPPAEMPSSLIRPGGAFVTLHKGHALRGCVGRIESPVPLFRTVYECAVSAALDDPRFEPVTAMEAATLQIEVSALSALVDILPGQIEVGVHGLVVSQASRRGLLLPQVATEWGWDAAHFLEQTCLKAGLAADAWRRGARVQAFTAQVFAEELRHAGSVTKQEPKSNRP